MKKVQVKKSFTFSQEPLLKAKNSFRYEVLQVEKA